MVPVFQHYGDEALLKFLLERRKVHGAVTLNAPIDTANGHIAAATAAHIKRIGEALVQKSK